MILQLFETSQTSLSDEKKLVEMLQHISSDSSFTKKQQSFCNHLLEQTIHWLPSLVKSISIYFVTSPVEGLFGNLKTMLDHKSVSILDVAISLKLLAEQRIRDSANDKTHANLTNIIREGEHKFIGIHATEFLYQEYSASQTLDSKSICTCSEAKVLGLPCRHQLKQFANDGKLPLFASIVPEELRSVDYVTPSQIDNLTQSENHEPEDSLLSDAEPDYNDLKVEMIQILREAKRSRRIKSECWRFVKQPREMVAKKANTQEQDQQITCVHTPGPHSRHHSHKSPLSFAFKKLPKKTKNPEKQKRVV
jgi:hypothetical protein